ncbi:S-adenosylmethionine synthase [Clostridia bacterium]|nr:S-adenosylmethionine synthase [Clostridia bacterium]
MSKQYLTSESVRAGHPDKLCDQIADAILDGCLRVDPEARVACEVMATCGRIIVAGEITCAINIYTERIVRDTLERCGYHPSEYAIEISIHRQSEDIAAGVSEAIEVRGLTPNDPYALIGAGDQGTVYGYATDETDLHLSLPYVLATRIVKRLDEAGDRVKGLKSDGKAQVTVLYEDGKPVSVESVIVSAQHDAGVCRQRFREDIIDTIMPCFAGINPPEESAILINPAGDFVDGGPSADTGLTGRKLMVDTFGGLVRHGGGAMSGKDSTKVDRSAAYMARHIAKALVMAKFAAQCEVSLSYAIGKANPAAVNVDTFGTSWLYDDKIREIIMQVFDLRPAAIIDRFKLKQFEYTKTAKYGHFTDPSYPWEVIDQSLIDALWKLAA